MNSESFQRGLDTRRDVLGKDYVDESIKNADEFNLPMQELVTEYCWDRVWNRPGLDRKTRSMLNIAMLTALNRPHELRLHVSHSNFDEEVRGSPDDRQRDEENPAAPTQESIRCTVMSGRRGVRRTGSVEP